ncbi:MAG: molybdopterin-dependent oxidoreductase [Candidatus Bathyarchaeota archaeon]|nr:molybdopterin-dependent oxidoreductase [Candidatus Bathyarchaeota archaeon]
MKKANKIALVALVVLVLVTVPVYVYMRQNSGTEGSILIKGKVGNPGNFTYSQLEGFAPVTVQVTLSSSGHAQDNGVFNYTGVPLGVVLEEADAFENATSVYLQAADGYGTTIPIADAKAANTILAYQKDGAALTALVEGGEGPLRLIIGNDQFAQRWIRGVSIIDVR